MLQKQSDSWIPWVPHDKYVQGLAYVVFLWVFVIRLAMWWYGGWFKLYSLTLEHNRTFLRYVYHHHLVEYYSCFCGVPSSCASNYSCTLGFMLGPSFDERYSAFFYLTRDR